MNQLIQVRIEFIGNEKIGQYGPSVPVLFKAGEDKIWKNYKPDHIELTALKKLPMGTPLQLAPAGSTQSGNPKYTVIIPESEADLPKAPTGKISPETKCQMASAIEQMADVWAYCYQQAHRKLQAADQTIEPETIRCCASALFIHVTRRFVE